MSDTIKNRSLDTDKPIGVSALFFIQVFATLGYAVLSSTLVLYTTLRLGFSESQASAMMGVFGAFNYGLHLFGGYLGGRYLSNRNLFVFGMLLQLCGCLSIALGETNGLYWGLALFLTGSGLNVTCINMMLTQRFSPEDDRREKAFLWNYAGMNIGFFIGYAVAGFFQISQSYHQLFLLTLFGNVIAVCLTACFWKKIKDINTPLTHIKGKGIFRRMSVGIIIIIILVPILRLLLKHTELSSYFVVCLGVLMFIVLCTLTLRHKVKEEQYKMLAYLILAMGSLVFWSLYQLAPMGLTLFTEHNLNLRVFGILVSPQWVQDINTVVIVIGGPLLAHLFKELRAKGWRIDIPTQFATSLFCMGLGMLVLTIGIKFAQADGLVAMKWMIVSYLLQSIGELLISPIGYAMVGRLAPARYQGIMMGSWMLVTGVASVLAGDVSMAMPDGNGLSPIITNPAYSHIFSQLGIGALAMGILLVILIPFLRRLILIPEPKSR